MRPGRGRWPGPGGWPGHRPPWWPENEAWPPADGMGPPWRRRGPGSLWSRVGCFVIGLVVFVAVLAAAASWIVAGLTGSGSGVGLLVAIVTVALIALGLSFGMRGIRRMAAPVDDLVEAAGRIAAGDYTVRVAERGPREARAVARAFNAMSSRLEATDAQRRTFVADVTHELRTPLAVIRGHAEGIADGVYPGDAEHVAPIVDATGALERLVDDLRTLALTEAGSLELHREPVDLEILLRDVAAGFAPEAAEAAVEVVVDIEPGLPTIAVDPARIRQVVANLLTNAIRSTPSGGHVTVSATGSPTGVGITVRDTGQGIPADLLPRVFERFARGPESRGAGLGLSIARDLVVAHGGEIAARSEPGGGTELRFTLPLALD